MKTKEEKIQLLNETVEFFKVNPRCVESGHCRYYLPDFAGCAVGRLIQDKALCRKFDNCGATQSNRVSDDRIFQFLPEDLKEYGAPFLRMIQILHDIYGHWSGYDIYGHWSGYSVGVALTSSGKAFVRDIAEKVARGEI